ncbi:MAG: N-acetylmuramoyl-L-alanine amidase, partial [Pseudomonadota bacterium]
IEGTTTAMVQEDMRAWHAGLSHWAGINDINSWSIGIEIANPGHLLDYTPFPDAQMTALEYLLSGMQERWHVNPQDVISHACIAPGRKVDPGEKLDWRRLACAGLAVWLDPPLERSAIPADLTALCCAAARLGYQVPDEPVWDLPMKALWRSLSMRWLGPSPLFGHPPCKTGLAHVEKLADRWPVQRGLGDV